MGFFGASIFLYLLPYSTFLEHESLKHFYQTSGWQDTMRRYDAAYLVDRDALNMSAREVLMRHLKPSSSSTEAQAPKVSKVLVSAWGNKSIYHFKYESRKILELWERIFPNDVVPWTRRILTKKDCWAEIEWLAPQFSMANLLRQGRVEIDRVFALKIRRAGFSGP